MSEYDAMRQAYYIGWVIRNRVEAGHRGQHTYYDVIHDPAQFSAFLDVELTRQLNTLDRTSSPRMFPLWHGMLEMASDIISMDRRYAPIGPEFLWFHHAYVNPRWSKPRPDLVIDGKYDLFLYFGID